MHQYDTHCVLEQNNMIDNTPLLIYILKESEIFKCGEMLTGIGGIIVAEVMLSILFSDCHSYFNANSAWCPSLPSKEKNQFSMGDLIHFIYC